MAAMPGLYNIIGVLAKFGFPILIDLDANNSNTIWNAVKTKTQKVQEKVTTISQKQNLLYGHGDKVTVTSDT